MLKTPKATYIKAVVDNKIGLKATNFNPIKRNRKIQSILKRPTS